MRARGWVIWGVSMVAAVLNDVFYDTPDWAFAPTVWGCMAGLHVLIPREVDNDEDKD